VPSIAARSLPISPELLQAKLAEFYRGLQAQVQELIAERLADAFDELDRAFDAALVVPRLRPGAPPEEIAVAVRQVTVVRDHVKQTLRQRALDVWMTDQRRSATAREAARRHTHTGSDMLAKPVVTPIVCDEEQPQRWHQWAH
jgi:hypothetical protein